MSRCRKYIKIIDELDKVVETQGVKLLEGRVTPDNILFFKNILSVMDKAWRVACHVDCIDELLEHEDSMYSRLRAYSIPEKCNTWETKEGSYHWRSGSGSEESAAESGATQKGVVHAPAGQKPAGMQATPTNGK